MPTRAGVALALLLATTAHAQQEVANTSRGKMLQIEGVSRPDLIPDYMAWEQAMRVLKEFLDMPRDKVQPNAKTFLDTLSSADAEALRRATAVFPEREQACAERLRTFHTETLRKQPDLDIESQAFAGPWNNLTLECRRIELDAYDRLMETFSDDARAAFPVYLDHIRTTMTVYVLARELDFYKLPR